ncbi:MAG: InlB B-repeat-containing protein [Clostridia bacterium]|nr:InlB B-repeat-containing protein [Clostridia bacterium]
MKRRYRIFSVIITLVLTVLIAVFTASAQTENTGTRAPEIKANTLSLKETVYLLYAVDFGEIPAGAEYGMLVWEAEEGKALPSSFTHESAASAVDLKSAGWQNVGGTRCQIFTYSGLAAKQMTDYVYSVAYIKNVGDTEYTYSSLSKYSILQYTIGSALNDSNRALLTALRGYGARAQEYFDYRTDRLADGDYVIANLKNGVFEDGTKVGVFKPGESVSATSLVTPLVNGADVRWYSVGNNGKSVFFTPEEIEALDSNFTLSPTVCVMNTNFDSGKKIGEGLNLGGKGGSTYELVDDGEGGYYVKHYKASGTGTDSQSDSNNTFDPQPHMYDPATGTYASKVLTYTVKLARTEADVADANFRLRHYPAEGSADQTATLFNLNSIGNVKLGGTYTIGTLTSEWQEYSFVVDFGAGDIPGEDNVHAYRDGHLMASTRISELNTDLYVKFTDAGKDKERIIINFWTSGTKEGELLFDDVSVYLGATPVCEYSGGILNYDTNGAMLPLDAPSRYSYDEPTPLPVVEKEGYTFDGWFTSQSYETKITEIPPIKAGVVTVYAKFTATGEYIDELKGVNSTFATDDFYVVDTTNQYNLPSNQYIDGATGLYDGYTGGTSTNKSDFEHPLVGKQDNYKNVDYGALVTMSEYAKLPANTYPDPLATPAGKSHPYLYFTKDQLPAIKALLSDPEMQSAVSLLWTFANTQNFTGVFEANEKNGVTYRYDVDTLAIIEAKAFAYVLTGDASYGYEAIIAVKNAILTIMYTTEQHTDPYHGPSHVLMTVIKVFDWCYDLLTETDKTQLVLGVQNRLCPAMEYNFFRKEQGLSSSIANTNYISGHGTGPQFVKDYLCIALCFYTEEPSWWDYIGGKYFAEYVKVWEVMYESGWVSQGTAGYGLSKYFYALLSSFIINNSTGIYPAHKEDAQKGAYFLLSHVNGADKYFSTGDGGRGAQGSGVTHEYMLLGAALYNDPALYAAARHYSNGFTRFFYNSADEITAPLTLIYSSYIPAETKEEYATRGDGIDMIQYFGDRNGFMSARNSWESDAAVTFMKIGEMTMGNHDISDHGTFQIYYKGMLAGSSGTYNKYGSYVHKYYLQATVAHNGLLVFDPALADDEPIYGTKAQCSDEACTHETCTVDYNNITNAARYYYSGSQVHRNETSSLDSWLGGNYDTGTVMAYSYAYNEDGSSKYAYIAGDVTKAYYDPYTGHSPADYVGRRMLTLYTGDEQAPMMFFVFDSITSKGADFTKSFLLHTVSEPVISDDGRSAEVYGAYGGKLSVNLISGAEKIEKIGGDGYAYWINGKNCTDQYAPSDNYKTIWGRLQIDMTGNITDNLLTAMYVSDTEDGVSLKVEKLNTDTGISGVRVKNTVALFVDDREPTYKKFSADTGSDGALLDYYVSGVCKGIWDVVVDGVTVASVRADADGEFLNFTAPAGDVTLSPRTVIEYVTDGGTLPEGAPENYNPDAPTPLPTPEKEGCVFEGWYTSSDLELSSKVTEVPADCSGTFTVYAKWYSVLLSEDYSKTEVSLFEASKTLNQIAYGGGSKAGASYTTKTDASGRNYLEWITGSSDPGMSFMPANKALRDLSSSEVSYTFRFSAEAGKSLPVTTLRLLAYLTADGTALSTSIKTNMLTVAADGTVKLGGSVAIGTITPSEITTVRIAVNFSDLTMRAYNADGEVIGKVAFAVPAESLAEDGLEFMKCHNKALAQFWTSSKSDDDSIIKIYGVKIDEGNSFAPTSVAKISYVTNGGTLPKGTSDVYASSDRLILPTPTKDKSIFRGWYTTPTFNDGTEISEIVGREFCQDVTVFAKWNYTYVNTDFTGVSISTDDTKNASYQTLAFTSSGKGGASFVTKTDENGKSYLEWTKGTKDSHFSSTSVTDNFATTDKDEVSLLFSFSKNGTDGIIGGHIRINSTSPVTNATSGSVTIFTISSTGKIVLSGTSTEIGNISDGEIFTARVVFDFANALIKIYDESGAVTASKALTPPSIDVDGDGVADSLSASEWKKCLTKYHFYWYSNSGTESQSLRIYEITVAEGNLFE